MSNTIHELIEAEARTRGVRLEFQDSRMGVRFRALPDGPPVQIAQNEVMQCGGDPERVTELVRRRVRYALSFVQSGIE